MAYLIIIEALLIAWLAIFMVFALFQLYAMWSAIGFVPSGKNVVRRMLNLGEVRAGMRIVELGSGNGELCIQAAERGATALGIELNPVLVTASRLRTRFGNAKNATFRRGNFWTSTLPRDTDAVFLYLFPPVMENVWQKLKRELKPGTVVISHAFRFPNAKPEATDGNLFKYRLHGE